MVREFVGWGRVDTARLTYAGPQPRGQNQRAGPLTGLDFTNRLRVRLFTSVPVDHLVAVDYEASPASDNPAYLAARERFLEGLRLAGVPEG